MNTWYSLIVSCLLLTATQSHAYTADWSQRLFRYLSAHPAFKTSIYQDQATILEQGSENYFAAFIVVKSEMSPWVCAFAAPFDAMIGTEPGKYVFKPKFICDTSDRLKAYEGLFQVKIPPCRLQMCANPAIGVGNLIVRPMRMLDLDGLSDRMPVEVSGTIELQNGLSEVSFRKLQAD